MSIITTIFGYLFFAIIGFFAVIIFIQCNRELWNEIGKDMWNDLLNWFKTTKIGMKINNKVNRVTVLADEEVYDRQIKHNIIINK